LDLEIISEISTDNSPAIINKEKGVIKLLIDKIESKNITHNCCKKYDLFIIHCLIHQQNSCTQVILMNYVTQVVIKTVNHIRSHALSHRQFEECLKELDSKYGDVVYFSHII